MISSQHREVYVSSQPAQPSTNVEATSIMHSTATEAAVKTLYCKSFTSAYIMIPIPAASGLAAVQWSVGRVD